jgi:hypothetical protein
MKLTCFFPGCGAPARYEFWVYGEGGGKRYGCAEHHDLFAEDLRVLTPIPIEALAGLTTDDNRE